MSLTKDDLLKKAYSWNVTLDEDINWTNEKLTRRLGYEFLKSHPELDGFGVQYVQHLETVMLCKHAKDEIKNFDVPPIESEDYVAEFKENGCRILLTYSPEEGFGLFTRKESDLTCLNNNIADKALFIKNGLVTEPKKCAHKFPYRFVLDGEILADGDMVIDGVQYSESNVEDFIQSIFSANTEKAKQIQLSGHNISLHIFDVLYFQKDNLDFIPKFEYQYTEDELTKEDEDFIENYYHDYLVSAGFIGGKKKAKPKKLYSYLKKLRHECKYDVMHLPFIKRRSLRKQLVNLLSKSGVPVVEVDGRDDMKVTYLEEVLQAGAEGCVVKNCHAPYIAGLRSSRSHRAALKYKQSISELMNGAQMYADFDVFITGANPPKSPRIKDMIGSLKCSIYMIDDSGEQVVHEIANVSGISHDWKRELAVIDENGKITLNPKYLNKVIAVDGMALSGTSLRFHHAVLKNKETLEFKAKQPTDCVWDKSTLEDMVLVRGK